MAFKCRNPSSVKRLIERFSRLDPHPPASRTGEDPGSLSFGASVTLNNGCLFFLSFNVKIYKSFGSKDSVLI